jgi:hypothetical protein
MTYNTPKARQFGKTIGRLFLKIKTKTISEYEDNIHFFGAVIILRRARIHVRGDKKTSDLLRSLNSFAS